MGTVQVYRSQLSINIGWKPTKSHQDTNMFLFVLLKIERIWGILNKLFYQKSLPMSKFYIQLGKLLR